MSPSLVASPRQELLLCCARTRLEEAQERRIRELLRQELDWDALLAAAQNHGVLPLVCRNLAGFAGALPAGVQQRLRSEFQASAQSNLELTGELVRLFRLLAGHGIAAIPYKGPLLAATVYGEIALRSFADLDLLLRREDVMAAKEVLLGAGYTPEYALNRGQERALLDSDYSYNFWSRGRRYYVELHWQVVPQAIARAFEPGRRLGPPCVVGGTAMPTLAAEDLLLFLCLHGSKHMWTRLTYVCDVAELLRASPQMDWPRLLERATGLGARRMLLLGLELAHRLLDAELPPPAQAALAGQSAAPELARWATANLLTEPPPELLGLPQHRFLTRVRERRRDRARYLLHTVFTPAMEDWLTFPLPAALFFLYPPLRVLRLLRKFGARRARLAQALDPQDGTHAGG